MCFNRHLISAKRHTAADSEGVYRSRQVFVSLMSAQLTRAKSTVITISPLQLFTLTDNIKRLPAVKGSRRHSKILRWSTAANKLSNGGRNYSLKLGLEFVCRLETMMD